MRIAIRTFAEADLPAALDIQAASYPAHLIEDADAFKSRLQFPTSSCLAATQSGELVGYMLAHQWVSRSPPPLGTVLAPNAATDGTLFIHDLAVSAAARGDGLGRRLVAHVLTLSARQGLERAELIAVEGANRFWESVGFVEDPHPALAGKVARYGDAARYMTRRLGAGD